MEKGSLIYISPKEIGIPNTHPECPTDLTVSRNSRGEIIWALPTNSPEQNEQIGIRNIQAIFLEKFPEFENQFPRDIDGTIAEEKREEAKTFILGKISNKQDFKANISNSPFNRKIYPYFEGSYSTIISKAFAPWGIKWEEPVTITQGRYIDSYGKSWVVISSFRERYGVGTDTILNLPGLKQTINGKTRGGNPVVLYDEEEITNHLEKLTEHKVDNETGILIDATDQTQWVPLSYMFQLYGLSRDTMERYLVDVPRREGRSRSNSQVQLFDLDKLTENLKAYLALPQIDKKTGRYQDENGHSWVVAHTYLKSRGIPLQIFFSAYTPIKSLPGRDKNGIKRTFYSEEELEEAITTLGLLNRKKQKPKGYWTQENIETAAREVYQRRRALTVAILHEERLSGLITQISTRYLGGMYKLRAKLGISETRKISLNDKPLTPEEADELLWGK